MNIATKCSPLLNRKMSTEYQVSKSRNNSFSINIQEQTILQKVQQKQMPIKKYCFLLILSCCFSFKKHLHSKSTISVIDYKNFKFRRKNILQNCITIHFTGLIMKNPYTPPGKKKLLTFRVFHIYYIYIYLYINS